MVSIEDIIKELREMIDRIVWDKRSHTKEETEAHRLITEALSQLPRNCDVGTAEDQIKRWQKYCETQTCCEECPCNKEGDISAKCFARWAQMPYESEVK